MCLIYIIWVEEPGVSQVMIWRQKPKYPRASTAFSPSAQGLRGRAGRSLEIKAKYSHIVPDQPRQYSKLFLKKKFNFPGLICIWYTCIKILHWAFVEKKYMYIYIIVLMFQELDTFITLIWSYQCITTYRMICTVFLRGWRDGPVVESTEVTWVRVPAPMWKLQGTQHSHRHWCRPTHWCT